MKDKDFFLEFVGALPTDDGEPGFNMGDVSNAVFKITEPKEARHFYNGYIQWLRGRKDREATAEITAQCNIGWCFGNGMPPWQQIMWNEVTGADHPIFGMALAKEPRPTSREIIESGRRIGEASKRPGGMARQIKLEKERFNRYAEEKGNS